MALDLLIKNAKVLIATDLATEAATDKSSKSASKSKKPTTSSPLKIETVEIHVGVKDGKITELTDKNLPAQQIIDAKGLHLLPGVIDSQVHFREPGMVHKEDLGTGTRGAALGGVTSIFEMPNTLPPTTTREAFEDKMRRASEKAWVNYAFYVGAAASNVDQLAELEKLPGCSGVKIFMGSSTGTLLVDDEDVLENVFRKGSRRVIIHSEDEKRLKERKHIATDSHDVHNHPIWRDEESALLSTQKLLRLSEKTGRPVHVLHVTSMQEMELLRNTKASLTGGDAGRVTVEVLPQHLTLFAPDCYERLGTKAQQNPPIRSKEHQEALWKALLDGTVDVLGSDHAPHTLEEKARTYPDSPSGMPMVQTLVPIMLNHINNGKLTLEKFVELVCENPRRVFGCKNKGRIAIGMDADFTLVDMGLQKTIENKWIASRSGWTPFDGMKVKGWPVGTIIGGKFVMQDGQILGTPQGMPVSFQF
jgi:dihydroorotase